MLSQLKPLSSHLRKVSFVSGKLKDTQKLRQVERFFQTQSNKKLLKKYYCSESSGGYKLRNGKRVYTREEVGKHNTPSDSWVVIGDKVYNISSWIEYHPGGIDVLKSRGGQDITSAFHDQSHSYRALDVLETLHIGYVETKKRYDLNPEWEVGNADKE